MYLQILVLGGSTDQYLRKQWESGESHLIKFDGPEIYILDGT